MSATPKQVVVWILLVPFLAVQVWLTFGPGGILDVYGFWKGFPEFFAMSLRDPLLAAGLVDFMTVAGFGYFWLLSDLPRNKRWGPKTWVWTVSYIVFPGLGFFVYFLWLNPEHRLLQN